MEANTKLFFLILFVLFMPHSPAIGQPKQIMRIYSIFIAIIVIVMVSLLHSTQVANAQSNDKQDFYIITSNGETLSTTLWEVEISSQSLHEIYSIDSTESVSPRSDFPEDEISVFDQDVADGHLFYLNADQSTISRYIDRAWVIDSQRILILERSEACNVVDNICYGYHEFKLVDNTSGQVTSIYQISYHGEVFNEWQCQNQRGLTIGTVIPNPHYDQFAFTVGSFACNREAHHPTAGYVVDFSNVPAQITKLPQATGLSWSPDGSHLAYFVRPSCLSAENASVNVLPVNLAGEPITLRDEPQYCRNKMFTAWVDNQTVIYAWKPGINDSESPLELFSHDITKNESSTVDQERILFDNTLFRLSNTEDTVLLGNQYNGELVAISTEELSNIQPLSVGSNQVFYNSRFNQYMFTDLSDTAVLRVNADLSTNTTDLSSLMTQIPKERVFYITPGHP